MSDPERLTWWCVNAKCVRYGMKLLSQPGGDGALHCEICDLPMRNPLAECKDAGPKVVWTATFRSSQMPISSEDVSLRIVERGSGGRRRVMEISYDTDAMDAPQWREFGASKMEGEVEKDMHVLLGSRVVRHGDSHPIGSLLCEMLLAELGGEEHFWPREPK